MPVREDEVRRARSAVERILLRIQVAQGMLEADVARAHGEPAGRVVRERFRRLVEDLAGERDIHDEALGRLETA